MPPSGKIKASVLPARGRILNTPYLSELGLGPVCGADGLGLPLSGLNGKPNRREGGKQGGREARSEGDREGGRQGSLARDISS